MPLLHEAADEGRIAGDNAGRYPDVRAQRRRAPLGIVFSEQQIATVGTILAGAAGGKRRSRDVLGGQGARHGREQLRHLDHGPAQAAERVGQLARERRAVSRRRPGSARRQGAP